MKIYLIALRRDESDPVYKKVAQALIGAGHTLLPQHQAESWKRLDWWLWEIAEWYWIPRQIAELLNKSTPFLDMPASHRSATKRFKLERDAAETCDFAIYIPPTLDPHLYPPPVGTHWCGGYVAGLQKPLLIYCDEMEWLYDEESFQLLIGCFFADACATTIPQLLEAIQIISPGRAAA